MSHSASFTNYKKGVKVLLLITVIMALLVLPSYGSGAQKKKDGKSLNQLEQFSVDNGIYVAAIMCAVWTMASAGFMYYSVIDAVEQSQVSSMRRFSSTQEDYPPMFTHFKTPLEAIDEDMRIY